MGGTKPNLSQINAGQVFSSFNELCRATGLPVSKGNSRRATEKTLARYLEWEKASDSGNSIRITEVFSVPKPEPLKGDDAYSKDILTCLRRCDAERRSTFRADRDREWETLYPLSDILAICGFVSSRWSKDAAEVFPRIKEMRKYVPLGTPEQTFYLFNRLNQRVYSQCVKYLDRSLETLTRKGYIDHFEKAYWVQPHEGKARRATPEEAEACEEVRKLVKEQLGIKFLNLYNSSRFHSAYQKALCQALPLSSAWTIRDIRFSRADDSVSEEDYLAARNRINKRTVKLLKKKADDDSSAEERDELEKARVALERKCSKDPEFRELAEIINVQPQDLLPFDFDMKMEEKELLRHALVSWFIEIGGAEEYIQFDVEFKRNFVEGHA